MLTLLEVEEAFLLKRHFHGNDAGGIYPNLLTDNVYATLIIAKIAMNLFPAMTDAILLALLIGSYTVISIPLIFIPVMSYIEGKRMPKPWFNSIGITIAVLSSIAMSKLNIPDGSPDFHRSLLCIHFVAVFITKHMQALVSFIMPNQQEVKDEYGKEKEVSKFIPPIFLYSGDMGYLDKLHCVQLRSICIREGCRRQ